MTTAARHERRGVAPVSGGRVPRVGGEERPVEHQRRRRPRGRRGPAAAWPGCSGPRSRVVRAVHAVAVPLTGADAGQPAVPDLVGRLLQPLPVLAAVGVEQAQVDGRTRRPTRARSSCPCRPSGHPAELPGRATPRPVARSSMRPPGHPARPAARRAAARCPGRRPGWLDGRRVDMSRSSRSRAWTSSEARRTCCAGSTGRSRPDERWVLLGPNGAGKTTLLQLASAQMHPTRGSVTLLGETPRRGRRLRAAAPDRADQRGAGPADRPATSGSATSWSAPGTPSSAGGGSATTSTT